MSVRSRSSFRHVCTQRSMIEFMRGIRTPLSTPAGELVRAGLPVLGHAGPGLVIGGQGGQRAADPGLTERMTRCGHPGCRCHADPPRLHGPYHQWTRKIGGKTVTRILTDDQLADYQPWSGNQRRLRALVAELETLSQEIAGNDPRWNR